MEKTIYRVDIKVYERAMSAEFPVVLDVHSADKFFRDGYVIPGYHSMRMEMTEEELEEFCDKCEGLGWMKIIGVTDY